MSRESSLDRIVELTEQGLSTRQIADVLHITCRSVTRGRRRRGVSLADPATPLTAEQIDHARQMLIDGASYAEVARTIGCNKETVRRRFPGRGWTREQSYDYLRTLRQLRVAL